MPSVESAPPKLNLSLSLGPAVLAEPGTDQPRAAPVLASLPPLAPLTIPPRAAADLPSQPQEAVEVASDVVVPVAGFRNSRPPEFAERLQSTRPAAAPGSAGAMAVVHEDGLDRILGEVRREEALVVPAGSSVSGDVEAPVVIVFGSVQGKATATNGPVVVMPGGVVNGLLSSRTDVIVAGTVEAARGQAVVASRVLLAESARVRGEIRCKSIFTYQGAKLDGRVLPVRERVA